MIIDVAVPADSPTWSKEEEKIDKYTELAWELRRIWKVQTRVVPVVIGALGTISTRHKDFLADLGIRRRRERNGLVVTVGDPRLLGGVRSQPITPTGNRVGNGNGNGIYIPHFLYVYNQMRFTFNHPTHES